MNNREIKAMMAELAPVIREFTAAALEPVLGRLAAVEQLQPVKGERGQPGADGKDADPVTQEQVVAAVQSMQETIAETIRSFLEENPPSPGKDGKDGLNGKDADPVTAAMVVDAVKALPDVIDEAVARYLDRNPPRVERGQPGVDGKDGNDGVGLAGAFIDRDGNLAITLSNGEVKNLGPVVGRDAEPGLGFDDMTEELADDGRTIIRRYRRGDQVKEFRHRISVVLDRGIYKADTIYQAGDGVTWAGSFWIAQEETTEKPDGGKGWRLAVKRGRDGKDGVVKSGTDAKAPIRVGTPAGA